MVSKRGVAAGVRPVFEPIVLMLGGARGARGRNTIQGGLRVSTREVSSRAARFEDQYDSFCRCFPEGIMVPQAKTEILRFHPPQQAPRGPRCAHDDRQPLESPPLQANGSSGREVRERPEDTGRLMPRNEVCGSARRARRADCAGLDSEESSRETSDTSLSALG